MKIQTFSLVLDTHTLDALIEDLIAVRAAHPSAEIVCGDGDLWAVVDRDATADEIARFQEAQKKIQDQMVQEVGVADRYVASILAHKQMSEY